MRRLIPCMAVLLAASNLAWAGEAEETRGRVVVVYNVREAQRTLEGLLLGSGWVVEHWILPPRMEDYQGGERVKRLADSYRGRLIFVADGVVAAAERPAEEEAPATVRATVTLRAFDGKAELVASARGEAAESGPTVKAASAAAVASACRSAAGEMLDKIKDAAGRIAVERPFDIIIRLHHVDQRQAIAEPLFDAAVDAVVKEGKGTKEGLDKWLDAGTLRFTGTVRFTGTAEELAAAVGRIAGGDAKYRPLRLESVLGEELTYRFDERRIRISVAGLDEATAGRTREAVVAAVNKIEGVTGSLEAYSAATSTLTMQVSCVVDAWELDVAAFEALRRLDGLGDLEMERLSDYAIDYRLCGGPRPMRIVFTNVDRAFHDGEGGKLKEVVEGLEEAGLKVESEKYEPVMEKRWIFTATWSGTKEALDAALWKNLAGRPALAGMMREPSGVLAELVYGRRAEAEETTGFRIEISKVDNEQEDGVGEALFSAMIKSLDIREPNKVSDPRLKEFVITGRVPMTIWRFNELLWKEVLSKEPFAVLSPVVWPNPYTLVLEYGKEPPRVQQAEVLLKGPSSIHFELYGRPFLTAITRLKETAEPMGPEYIYESYTGRLSCRFAGTAAAFVEAIEEMRKKEADFGRFFELVGRAGNSVWYEFNPGGERLILVGNVPRESLKAAAAQLEQAAAAACGGQKAKVATNEDAGYIMASVATQIGQEEFLSAVAQKIGEAGTPLSGAGLRDVYSNVIEFAFSSAENPLGEPAGPFNRRLGEGSKPPQVETVADAARLVGMARERAAAVVRIVARADGEVRDGCGVMVSPRGYILTTRTAVEGALSPDVMVRLGERWYKARIVVVGKEANVALIQIAGSDFKAVAPADSSKLTEGKVLLCVGGLLSTTRSPQGLSVGIVTGLERAWSGASRGAGTRRIFKVAEHSIVSYSAAGGTAVFDTSGRLTGLLIGGDPRNGYEDARDFIPINAAREVIRMIGY